MTIRACKGVALPISFFVVRGGVDVTKLATMYWLFLTFGAVGHLKQILRQRENAINLKTRF